MATLKGKGNLDKATHSPHVCLDLSIEVFSRLLQQFATHPDYNFHPKCVAQQLTYLVYADDLLLFARGDLPSVGGLINFLDQYACMARLTTNKRKSNIYMARVDEQTRDHLSQLTSFQMGQFPFRYLGIPLATERLRASNYNTLIDSLIHWINS